MKFFDVTRIMGASVREMMGSFWGERREDDFIIDLFRSCHSSTVDERIFAFCVYQGTSQSLLHSTSTPLPAPSAYHISSLHIHLSIRLRASCPCLHLLNLPKHIHPTAWTTPATPVPGSPSTTSAVPSLWAYVSHLHPPPSPFLSSFFPHVQNPAPPNSTPTN